MRFNTSSTNVLYDSINYVHKVFNQSNILYVSRLFLSVLPSFSCLIPLHSLGWVEWLALCMKCTSLSDNYGRSVIQASAKLQCVWFHYLQIIAISTICAIFKQRKSLYFWDILLLFSQSVLISVLHFQPIVYMHIGFFFLIANYGSVC